MAREEKGDNDSSALSVLFSTRGLFGKYPHISLDDLMSGKVEVLKEVYAAFRQHAKDSFTSENLDFLHAVHQLKDQAWDSRKVAKIRAQYTNENAPALVNLSSPQQASLNDNRASYDIFCDAVEGIRSLVELDITPRFLKEHLEFKQRMEILDHAKALRAHWNSFMDNYRKIIPKESSRFFSQQKSQQKTGIVKKLLDLKHNFIKFLGVNPRSNKTDLDKLYEKLSSNKIANFETCYKALEALEGLEENPPLQEAQEHADAFTNIFKEAALLKDDIKHLMEAVAKEQPQPGVQHYSSCL